MSYSVLASWLMLRPLRIFLTSTHSSSARPLFPGWFFVDRSLAAAGSPTQDLTFEYANNHSDWLHDWCGKAQELSLLGVDPAPAGFTVQDGWVPPASILPSESISSSQTSGGAAQGGGKGSAAADLPVPGLLGASMPETVPVPLPLLTQLLSAFLSSFNSVAAVGGKASTTPAGASPGSQPVAPAPAY